MKDTRILCDVCGMVKGATNHWFTVEMDIGWFHVSRWVSTDDKIDVCGEACVHRKLNEFLANQAN